MNWGVRAGLGRKMKPVGANFFRSRTTWVVVTVAMSRRTSLTYLNHISDLCGQGVLAVELLLMNPELSSVVIDLAVAC